MRIGKRLRHTLVWVAMVVIVASSVAMIATVGWVWLYGGLGKPGFLRGEKEPLTNSMVAYYSLRLKKDDPVGDDNIEHHRKHISPEHLTVIEGEDGVSLRANDIVSMNDPEIESRYGEGGHVSKLKKRDIAKYRSHYRIYQQIESQSQNGLFSVILENTVKPLSSADSEWESNVSKTVMEFYRQTPKFDLAVWDSTTDETANSKSSIRKWKPESASANDKDKLSLGAYILNNKRIAQLLSATKVMKNTLEETIRESVKKGELHVYLLSPPLVEANL